MSSVWVRPRTSAKGAKRYMVCYRLGGRYGRERSAGTFETKTLAQSRRMKVMELISRGEHNQIPELVNPAAAAAAGSWTALHRQWIDGTHNLKPSTRRTYERHGRSLANDDRRPRPHPVHLARLPRPRHQTRTARTLPEDRQGLHRHPQARPRLRRSRPQPGPRPARQTPETAGQATQHPQPRPHQGDPKRPPTAAALALRHPRSNRDPRRRAQRAHLGRPRRHRVQAQDLRRKNPLRPPLGQAPTRANRPDRSYPPSG